MAGKTSIEWTAIHHPDGTVTPGMTWNPVTGCTEVSPGCDYCYARAFAERFRGVPGHPYEQGFDVTLWPERLALPLRWKKGRMIFVNSMSDLYHKEVPDAFILDVFSTMMQATHHIYQVLTKRPSRLVNTSLLPQILERVGGEWPAHIWQGVSVETQDYAWRVDSLRRVPAPIRFLSAEPLLGPLTLDLTGIAQVITGAESGHGARPMDDAWVRALRDQCQSAGASFFFKQRADARGHKHPLPELDGLVWRQVPDRAGLGLPSTSHAHTR
ncbi:MAG: phage Gp37/Gp68 family protein [Chloroflexota bacterium]|nr:phage Gp37/Gp68 family protein [Chloroflexota bacterium]